jgi:hypothetical protein
MSWTAPRTWVAGELVTAALFNTHIRDNETELRGGGVAVASQAALDFVFASSASQFGRLAPAARQIPRLNAAGNAWEMVNPVDLIYPVGSIFISTVSTNPNTLLGHGTWSAFATGRTLVGIDTGQTEFDVVEETGGAKTHTLSVAEMPAHAHPGSTVALSAQDTPNGGAAANGVNSGGSTGVTVASQGGGGAHNNLQPYIVVYIWKRTA